MYDGRGSVALEATYNAAWAVLGSWLMPVTTLDKSYSPFGEMLEYKISGYGFNGEQYDAATGMINLRARQYEPGMMRFAQKDSVPGQSDAPLTQNLYLYCAGDPVNMVDPSGHEGVLDSFRNTVKNKVTKYWNSDQANKSLKKDFEMLQQEADVLGSVKVLDEQRNKVIKPLPASKVIALHHLAEDSIIEDPNFVSELAGKRLEALSGSYNAHISLSSDDIKKLRKHYETIDPSIRNVNNWCWENQGLCQGILDGINGAILLAYGYSMSRGGGQYRCTTAKNTDLVEAEIASGNRSYGNLVTEGGSNTNPYNILNKNNIPQTLSAEEIASANELDLQMMAKKDIKMVNDVAKEVGVDRNDFGEYIHELKADLGMKASQNFTYKELLEYATQLKGK